jgi:hypothetical protein
MVNLFCSTTKATLNVIPKHAYVTTSKTPQHVRNAMKPLRANRPASIVWIWHVRQKQEHVKPTARATPKAFSAHVTPETVPPTTKSPAILTATQT